MQAEQSLFIGEFQLILKLFRIFISQALIWSFIYCYVEGYF